MIVDFISELKPGDALDIGAGNGRNSLYLAENGWAVDALDIDENALRHIDEVSRKKSLLVHTILQDFMRHETPRQYDVILCLMTLHFLSQQDIKLAIDWMKVHTKPGGTIVISGFNSRNAIGARPYLFSNNELAELFTEWTIIHYEDDSPSSILSKSTQKIETYHVSRIVAKKPY